MSETRRDKVAGLLLHDREDSPFQTALMILSGISLILLLTLPSINSRENLVTMLIIDSFLLAIFLMAIFLFHLKKRLTVTASHSQKYLALIVSAVVSVLFVSIAGTRLNFIIYYDSIKFRTIQKLVLSLPYGDQTSQFVLSGVPVWILVIILGILSFGLTYLFLKKILVGIKSTFRTDGKITTILFGISSAIWALIPLLPLYAANLGNVSVLFVVTLAIVYMIVTLLIYLITIGICQSPIAGFVFCAVIWFGLSISYSVFEITGIDVTILNMFFSLILLLVIAGTLAYAINKFVHTFNLNREKISKFILILVLIFIIIGILPILFTFATASDLSIDEKPIYSEITKSLPNIYWLHAESMVDPEVLTEEWGIKSNLSENLESKGFVVNPDAYIDGSLSGSTQYSLSSLFSPTFYDTYGNQTSVSEVLISQALEQNELIRALESVGYHTESILSPSDAGKYIISPSMERYVFSDQNLILDNRSSEKTFWDNLMYYEYDMDSKFIKYGILPIYEMGVKYLLGEPYIIYNYYNPSHADCSIYGYINTTEKKRILNGTDWLTVDGYSSFLDAFAHVLDDNTSPRLVLIYPWLAHRPYSLDANGNLIADGSSEDLKLYPEKYLFSEKILNYLIDSIQKTDSNGIIIIVGDHGPEIPEYAHILSAIYIPEQYQTTDYTNTTKNPRNIARYLVNTFVGQNYEYLPTENSA